MRTPKIFIITAILFLTVSCTSGQWTAMPLARSSPTATLTSTPLPTATRVPSPTFTPQPTATSDPYLGYTIDYLRARPYGEGNIEIVQTLSEYDAFTRYVIRYVSDGLNIYSVLTVPGGEGPFPVMIVLHGYEWPVYYNLYTESLDTDDGFVREGYLVLHPAMRNYSPSDSGDNLFRVGLAIDVLNLIALVKSQGGQEGALAQADPDRIGLWGYSMGGGIALRVLTVTSDVDAAVLYSPISGDETRNLGLFAGLAGNADSQFSGERNVPEAELARFSPSHYYSLIASPILIFHGTADDVVPVNWTVETCDLLTEAGKSPDCIYYDGAAHSFLSRYLQDMMPRMYEFYARYLRQ
jgi:dipeptidyl aminopeptidase/acylaminoacyl peptidase